MPQLGQSVPNFEDIDQIELLDSILMDLPHLKELPLEHPLLLTVLPESLQ